LKYNMKHFVVIVLGDLGRSPRMQYHAYSLAQRQTNGVQHRVSLIGYKGEATTSLVSSCTNITEYRLATWDLPFLRKISILHAVVKGIALVVAIILQLLSLPKYDVIVIQNPPCLPALLVAIILSLFNGSKIMLDWHNLGFAMFAEKLGKGHLLVRIARAMEHLLVSFATSHICVSTAMRAWLLENFKVRATVLYDRPPSIYKERKLSVEQRHELLMKLQFIPAALFPAAEHSRSSTRDEATIQTLCKVEKRRAIELLPPPTCGTGRTALVMSCTSWTPDEDFDLLLESLLQLEARLAERAATEEQKKGQAGYDRLLLVVTGKGPLRASFEERVQHHCAEDRLGRFVAVRTAWLEPGDYPALLRCANLGVSLHTSTSGIDLPMKVLDMFGSGVPVCAASFPALSELVQHGVNGLAFNTAAELTEHILRLLMGCTKRGVAKERAGSGLEELSTLKRGAEKISSWEENWNDVVPPLLDSLG
jgi:beta-1,4-mannosyltransferase